jgi:hypothetical protein
MAAEEAGDGGPTETAGVRRPGHRLEQIADGAGHLPLHHAGSAGRDGPDVEPGELAGDLVADVLRPHDDADVAGVHRSRGFPDPQCRRLRIEQRDDPPDHGLDELVLAVGRADAQHLDGVRADDPRPGLWVRCSDGFVADVRAGRIGGIGEEHRPVHDLVERLDDRPVGPSVHRQRAPRGGTGERDVGIHVGAPEAVDRLLRVTHRDQPPVVVAGEEPVEQLPLQGIGVLGFVHDGELEPLPELGDDGRASLSVHDLPGESQQVVVARLRRHRPVHPRDAPRDDVTDGGKLLPLVACGRGVGGLRGLDPISHERIAGRGVDQRHDPVLGPQAAVHRFADEFVVDHLGEDPVAGVLAVLVLHLPARARQHPPADGVDGGDRGRVELGGGPLEPAGDRRRIARRAAAEMRVERVGGFEGGVSQQRRRGDDPPPHAVAELGRGIAREGGDEDLADAERGVRGEGERHVGGDGVRLAGAGAGIDDRAHGERVCGVVEALRGSARRVAGVVAAHDSTYVRESVNSRANSVWKATSGEAGPKMSSNRGDLP